MKEIGPAPEEKGMTNIAEYVESSFRIPESHPRLARELGTFGLAPEEAQEILRSSAERKWAAVRKKVLVLCALGTLGVLIGIAAVVLEIALGTFSRGLSRVFLLMVFGGLVGIGNGIYIWNRGRGFGRIARG